MTEPTLRSTHLFTLTLQVDPNFTDIGETPYGRRRIATVTGGTFEGEELRVLFDDKGGGMVAAMAIFAGFTALACTRPAGGLCASIRAVDFACSARSQSAC